MLIVPELKRRWQGKDYPFMIGENFELVIDDILSNDFSHLKNISTGEVVALIGDFEPRTISDFLYLIDKGVIIVPLTLETHHDHEYFFKASFVDWIVVGGRATRRKHTNSHQLLIELRKTNKSGLVLFSTGTTGRPKAILHDFDLFLQRYSLSRPTQRTLAFLLFDHIGGINTLLHTIFNTGVIITTKSRNLNDILSICEKYFIEVLPTTPTFLRMMLLSGAVPTKIPKSLKIITYGTERMDQQTLSALCALLPEVDFRQTFGMSELGIVRAKSERRDSLFLRIGGEGIETRIIDSVLHIKSASRMLGYLNFQSPFDSEGWYDTGDRVESRGDFIKFIGRTNELINVGGLKFMPSEVERVILEFPQIEFVKVEGCTNPITGQHVEISIQVKNAETFEVSKLRTFLSDSLPVHMQPRRIKLDTVRIGHRFKRL